MAIDVNAQRVAIVDLNKTRVHYVGIQAAKIKLATDRFALPSETILSPDATPEDKKALEVAAKFNEAGGGDYFAAQTSMKSVELPNPVVQQVVEVPVEQVAEVPVETKIDNAEEPQAEIKEAPIEEGAKAALPVLADMVIRELQEYAFENNIDLKGKTKKADIIDEIVASLEN